MKKSAKSVVRVALATVVLLALAVAQPVSSAPQNPITINVQFDSTAKVIESDGVSVTATASTLNDEQKTKVKAMIKTKWEQVALKNPIGDSAVVTVLEAAPDPANKLNVIISGGAGPGDHYGDSGRPGPTAIVHQGQFTDAAFMAGDGLTNAIGETAAHELAHRANAHHNLDITKLMAQGGSKPEDCPPPPCTYPGVSPAERVAGTRPFIAEDITLIKENLLRNMKPKGAGSGKDVLAVPGSFVSPANIPDDELLDADVTVTGPPGVQYGYVNEVGAFVLMGQQGDSQPIVTISDYTAPYDFAISFDGGYSYHDAATYGTVTLSTPNPSNPSVFLHASINFTSDSVLLALDGHSSYTGGFLDPEQDADGDGCRTGKEAQTAIGSQTSGGRRDYLNHYDFFNPVDIDKQVLVPDILAVVQQYFNDDLPGPIDYKSKTDRTYLGPNVWNLGPPDGLQRVPDILAVVYQYFHNCS